MSHLSFTSCQICGRGIKAKLGVIAHHGYTRPGDGWQTASCYGARHLAWEKSCAIIPLAIGAVEAHLALQVVGAAQLEASPPDVLEYRASWTSKAVDIAKPADFKPEANPIGTSPRSYAGLFYRARSGYERRIRQAKLDRDGLVARYAEWHKLHPECEGDTLA